MKLIDKKEERVVQLSDATAFEHEVNRVLETLADDGLDVQMQGAQQTDGQERQRM